MKKTILSLYLVLAVLAGTWAQQSHLIGITDTHAKGVSSVPRTYVDAVFKGGNIPVVIPLIEDEALLEKLISTLDAVILPGGEDVNPARYDEKPSPHLGEVNEKRDDFEFMIIQLCVNHNIPIVGICRGMQVINVYFGGTLFQDLPTDYIDKSIIHRQSESREVGTHTISVEPGSYLHKVTDSETLLVNSFHHQGVKKIAPGFIVTARAADGVVEAFESIDRPIIGVQFHPEALMINNDSTMINIFRYMPVRIR